MAIRSSGDLFSKIKHGASSIPFKVDKALNLLSPQIKTNWMVGSYSALTRQHPKSSYTPETGQTRTDDDKGFTPEELRQLEEDIEAKDFFAFPRGANPGTAIHEVFEHIDFQDDKRHLVLKYLEKKYGKECTATLGNINRMKPRSAISRFSEALSIPPGDVEEFKDSIIR